MRGVIDYYFYVILRIGYFQLRFCVLYIGQLTSMWDKELGTFLWCYLHVTF